MNKSFQVYIEPHLKEARRVAMKFEIGIAVEEPHVFFCLPRERSLCGRRSGIKITINFKSAINGEIRQIHRQLATV